MEHPFKHFKVKQYKPGQLVTVDHVVYRCTACKSWAGCNRCEIKSNKNHIRTALERYYKICVKCGLFTTFKRLSK